jgi:hypothetical protein
MSRNIHTVRRGKAWVNVRPGKRRPLSLHHSQEDAICAGRHFARRHRCGHIIHGPNGRICARKDYDCGASRRRRR